MFTTGIFVSSLLRISTFGDWRISGAGRGKTKKKKKSSSSSNNNNFFVVLCENKEPLPFYETILNKTEVDYYEKNHLLYLERRTLVLNIATVPYIA